MKSPRFLLRRRTLLTGSGLLAAVPFAAAVDGLCITPRRLVTTTHAVGRGPSGGPSLRVAQVTDMHMQTLTPFYERLIERIHDVRPEVLLFTGDMIERPDALSPLDAFLAECPDVPKFAVLGNWEYWSGVPRDDYRKLYEKHGIDLLVNRSVTVSKEGRDLRITGLDDFVGGRPDPAVAVRGTPSGLNHLVLAHCPLTRDVCPMPEGHEADVVVSGHTHGGQIAPMGFAVALPPGSGSYVAGWYRDDGPPLYVCRGIGTSMMPVRIGATPELSVFEWALA